LAESGRNCPFVPILTVSTSKTANQIRAEFLSFFKEKGHTIVPSDSLVPGNDPTLMFTNAGMNQFKDVFLGEGERSYVRAADTQKCLRVSGKHNDLDEVGYDTYHHTFFEMLGNWSFGDYFKKEAIGWAWELLTERWGLDPARMYATVHEGDQKLGLEADTEAEDYWKSETSIPHDHIMRCWSKDNFWMMGDTGPCGPCSEIHYDMRSDEERAAKPGIELVNNDHPQVIEIWNLVFIQYNAQNDGSLKTLPAKHVDTGAGFERVVAVLQGKKSNYDTDVFSAILDAISAKSKETGGKPYQEIAADPAAEKQAIALRVMADHLRTISFAVADGVMPGNAGRGYVIRRILRRAVRYGYQTLGFREPMMTTLVGVVVREMGDQFPELKKQQAYIERVVRAEEESFLETLGTGIESFELVANHLSGKGADAASVEKDRAVMDLLTKAWTHGEDRKAVIADFLKNAKEGRLAGEIAFLLHDTYGFPVDLTQLMAREAGFDVDMKRYAELMDEQKERARAASSFKVDMSGDGGWTQVSQGDDSAFTGYEAVDGSARIRAMRTVEGKDGAQHHELILDATPFYAESGGQVGDTGILNVGGEDIRVLDTQKQGGKIIHLVDRLPEDAASDVRALVDAARRDRIVKHHSVTHLMHAALRERLGDHVAQKGSLVSPGALRFDFSHFEKVGDEDLRAIEDRVNAVIQRNIAKQEERDVPIKEALSRGATALFGEKYGERVRMITFDADYSIELCGGIHVGATGEIGLFRFVSEGSVAAGIRRVEAVAGMDALLYTRKEADELGRVRGQFKTLQRPSDEEVADLLARTRALEKEAEALRVEALRGNVGSLIAGAQAVKDIKLITGRIDGADSNALQTLVSDLRDQVGNGHVVLLASADMAEGKVMMAASVADDLIGRGLQAGKLVGAVAKLVGGGGGGRPQMATAGGKQPENLDSALTAVSGIVSDMLG
jgi:alanyl-tRNA synthetase